MKNDGRISVIGGGLVGSLEACLLANRGIKVDLYESREDIRTLEHVQGRSINLALSIRGRAALKAVGLENKVIQDHGIPMRARLIHDLNGHRRAIPYGKDGQSIYSVGRRFLNETLLTHAENHSNVTVHFSHKLLTCNFKKGTMKFSGPKGETVQAQTSLIVGCDGAYSTVRREMMKQPRFDYNQSYISHGYLELCIPTKPNGEFAMEVNYLHIWPRGNFMMIALPNQDRTYTVTLFSPFEVFEELDSASKLLKFFKRHFPDAIDLIGREKLVEDFFRVKPSPLVSVKCSPYHVDDKVVLLGDAAHAMVPFYGQGLNAGFEDCLILDQFLNESNDDFCDALRRYSEFRVPDAQAICDLAMYNYVEMRDLVNSNSFVIRKKVDNLLNRIFSQRWVPLYSMVTFSRTRYHECILNKKWQDKVIHRTNCSLVLAGLVTAVGLTFRFLPSQKMEWAVEHLIQLKNKISFL